MWQQALVFVIVAVAFVWAAWYWMPAAWRRSLAQAIGRGGRRAGLAPAGAERIVRAVADAPGCGSCESCGSCATPGKPAKPAQGLPDDGVRPVTVHPRH
ncbi:hypothetical protein [Xylophilus sp. GOD-11R]|uniref:hypothetical protein n=1 Tax=Xylophilus sp. GOD-11R TaxID=3089814 RepID=UPI00298CFFAA|nr:hypothetical protein [Xylophilus sp. GOD-11R]WPB56029.1 hypothetical protein R9X41_18045 [Xylophilus sp. GOD-11R]